MSLTFGELFARTSVILFLLLIIVIFKLFNLFKNKTFPLYCWSTSLKEKTALASLCIIAIIAFLFLKSIASEPFIVSAILGTVFLFQPWLEEILFRGMIFGVSLHLIDKEQIKSKQRLYTGFALILQSAFFVLLHLQSGRLAAVMRFSTGVFFGLLFIYGKRNVLPSTAAHLFYNYIVYQLDIFGF